MINFSLTIMSSPDPFPSTPSISLKYRAYKHGASIPAQPDCVIFPSDISLTSGVVNSHRQRQTLELDCLDLSPSSSHSGSPAQITQRMCGSNMGEYKENTWFHPYTRQVLQQFFRHVTSARVHVVAYVPRLRICWRWRTRQLHSSFSLASTTQSSA